MVINLNGIKIHDVKAGFSLDNLPHVLYCKFDLNKQIQAPKINKMDLPYASMQYHHYAYEHI